MSFFSPAPALVTLDNQLFRVWSIACFNPLRPLRTTRLNPPLKHQPPRSLKVILKHIPRPLPSSLRLPLLLLLQLQFIYDLLSPVWVTLISQWPPLRHSDVAVGVDLSGVIFIDYSRIRSWHSIGSWLMCLCSTFVLFVEQVYNRDCCCQIWRGEDRYRRTYWLQWLSSGRSLL